MNPEGRKSRQAPMPGGGLPAPWRSLSALLLLLVFPSSLLPGRPDRPIKIQSQPNSRQSPVRQLLAVRGAVARVETRGDQLVAITVRPGRDFPEVTVVARQNDLVGSAVTRESGTDLLGVLAGEDSGQSDKISAAELQQGDVVSVIYDPDKENQALEIYIH